MPEKFEQRIHDALYEGIHRKPSYGSEVVNGRIPGGVASYSAYLIDQPDAEIGIVTDYPDGIIDDDDVFETDEDTDVKIGFDWAKSEPRTRDYPGSPGGIQLTRVYLVDSGEEFDLDKIPEGLQRHFESIAMEYMENEFADHRV